MEEVEEVLGGVLCTLPRELGLPWAPPWPALEAGLAHAELSTLLGEYPLPGEWCASANMRGFVTSTLLLGWALWTTALLGARVSTGGGSVGATAGTPLGCCCMP